MQAQELITEQVKHGQYRCYMCKGVYSYGWTKEKALAEADSNGFDVNDCDVICDDCYKETPWGRTDT